MLAELAAPLALPPFMFLELFVGAVQAYVFFMLAIVFVSLGTVSHHEAASSDGPLKLAGEAPV